MTTHNKTDFLTGEDYPHLCEKCRQTISSIAEMFIEGLMPDTDDNEAPIMYVYDHRMYCGGSSCRVEDGDEDGDDY